MESIATSGSSFVKPNYCFERGLCLLFNHTDYDLDNNMKLPERHGSDADVKAIVNYFTKCRIKVEVFDNKLLNKIQQILQDYSKDKYNLEYDFLIVIVLSHGKEDKLYAYDVDYKYSVLYEPFLPQNCELLKGKPKAFIISACQGKEIDTGIQFDYSKVPLHVPEDDDFIVILSAVPGFKSYRHPYDGTFAVREFIECLNESRAFGLNEDIVSILTNVNRRVSNIKFSKEQSRKIASQLEENEEVKMMTMFFSTLRNELAIKIFF
ncbi:caspase-1-like isoform 1 [Leptotrombidium deliense]|uniref:Caspase-1-like isoform 1 n=1 Tax=Leptotrombidium deliense TaxID=299467 RepID=A0A443SAG1_9ACAR|nr:caspase-1-like isoform 1 [Leptotrombidium deliense]